VKTEGREEDGDAKKRKLRPEQSVRFLCCEDNKMHGDKNPQI
jgi:hypothetical protein